ncbi:MAG: LamG domain-containing protein [Victivallaceae bacterium]
MRIINGIKLLGFSLFVMGVVCQAEEQTGTFADKLEKISVKPTIAVSFANKKLETTGTAMATLQPVKGEPVFVTGPNNDNALVISDQDTGVTGLNISGGKICSAAEGSFVCFFTPLVVYEDKADKRHYFFSKSNSDGGIYCYIMTNSRLMLQFRDLDKSWPSYQFDYKWSKTGETFEAGKWYHIGITWNSVESKLFVNGILKNKWAKSHKTTIEFKNIMLGTYNGQSSLNGAIANVAFFDQSLSAEDIKVLSAK